MVVQIDEARTQERERWRSEHAEIRNVIAPAHVNPYSCPCCGHLTLSERGSYELCPECGWEDDGQDEHDSHVVRRGPNGAESLDDARRRYVAGGGELLPHHPPAEPR
jgi:hypothetical protein